MTPYWFEMLKNANCDLLLSGVFFAIILRIVKTLFIVNDVLICMIDIWFKFMYLLKEERLTKIFAK